MKLEKHYNYVTDFILFVSFLGVIASSFVLWFILPMGMGFGGSSDHCPDRLTGQGDLGNSMLVFDWPRYVWVDIHSWISIALLCLMFIHLTLHWKWLVESIKKLKLFILEQKKTILERYITVCTLLIGTVFEVLSGFIIWLVMPRGVGDRLLSQSDIGRTFWGLQRNEWVDLHAWVAVFIVAIVVVHLVIHWRWIINIILGKRKSEKVRVTMKPSGIQGIGVINSGSTLYQNVYLLRLGILIGLVGAICFSVAMLTFQFDWAGRYDFMLLFIPIPFISIIMAKRLAIVSGTLLIMLGIAAIFFYLIFPIGIIWNKVGVWNSLGLETLYTVLFITLPLAISGILFIISEGLKKWSIHTNKERK